MRTVVFILIALILILPEKLFSQARFQTIPAEYKFTGYASTRASFFALDSLVAFNIRTKASHNSITEYAVLQKIEVIGDRGRASFGQISIDHFISDTSIVFPLSLTQNDSNLTRLTILLTYKQSHIVQNWLFFKKYATSYHTQEFEFTLINPYARYITLPVRPIRDGRSF